MDNTENMNLHYLFNVRYYKTLNTINIDNFENNNKNKKRKFSNEHEKNVNVCNKSLINAKTTIPELSNDLCDYYFELKTTYPGLLIGLGYTHDAGSSKEEIQLGFNLDYVTGLPIIPGSTIKGVLRSAFSNYPEYILYLLKEFGTNNIGKEQIKEIENEIFGDRNGNTINSTIKDVFYDAIIIGKDNKDNKDNKDDKDIPFLGLENITPHKASDKKYNGLTEPTPLLLLKVIPNIIFLFRFQLTDKGLLNPDTKLKLFKRILLDMGLGSKTNTGFGVLEEVKKG